MRTIYAHPDKPNIRAGNQGEHLATDIVFDVSHLEKEFGPGDVHLMVQRKHDAEPYLAAVETVGSQVHWVLTASDTAFPGYGTVQLMYLINGRVAKDEVYHYFVEAALGSKAAPDPELPYLAQVAANASRAESAAEQASAHAQAAKEAQSKAEMARKKAEEAAAGSGGGAVDPTLTKEGQAADAQKTGDEIRKLWDEKVAGPAPTEADNGKVLGVVNGKYALVDGGAPAPVKHSIAYKLTNILSDNNIKEIEDGRPYKAKLSAAAGYCIGNPTITMGGENITQTAYDVASATITINSVTADLIIECAGITSTDTSPKTVEREAALDAKGKILHASDFSSTEEQYKKNIKNFGITGFYSLQSGDTGIRYSNGYHMPETPGFGSKGPKHQLFKADVFTDYYTPAWNKEVYMAITKASNKFRMTLALDGLEDSYAYSTPSGTIYYAGKNTEYYGKQNINGVTPAAVSKARTVDLAYSMDALTTGNEEVKTYPGLTPEYVQMVTDNYNAMMTEARGDYDKIPFVLHTDQHGRVRASNHVFELIGDLTDWYEVSKCINLGDTSSTVFDAGQLQTYLDVLHDHIPYSKRVELYGNHDVWQKIDGKMNYELEQKILSPYFKNIYGRRFSNNGYFTTIDRWYNVKYLCISDYEYASNSSARRMTTAQANFFVEELSRDDGYDIILCAHQPLDGNKNWVSRDPTATPYIETFLSDPTANASLLAMIKARHDFTAGTFTDSEGGEHPYDFSGLKTKLLCQISGHAHFEAYYNLPGSITEFIFDWFDGNTFYWGYIDRKAMKMVFWKNATDAGAGRLEVPLA